MRYVDKPKTKKSYWTGFSLTHPGGQQCLQDSKSLLPLPAVTITEVCDSVKTLARVATSQQEIKLLDDSAYGDKTLSISL
jgi:hypothetical protein